MVYGPLSARKPLPKQDWETVLLMSDRFERDAAAHATWAEVAKKCTEYVEGKQWTVEALKELADDGRPALTFNKIAPLVRVVMGYFSNNRTDEKYLPSHDESSTAEIALALTKTAKQMSEVSQQSYVDTEVFMDGLIGGRGYYDFRLDFEENELGEGACSALDPFAVYLDCDGDQYDINKSSRVTTSRWGSIEDMEAMYGNVVRRLIEPLVMGGGYAGMPAAVSQYITDEITPWRTFGGDTEMQKYGYGSAGSFEGFMHNHIDPTRKNIRIIDQQHYKRVKTRMVIDLDTGQMKALPDHWKFDKVQRLLMWQEEKYAALGRVSPIRYDERVIRRVRWTTLVGDIIVHDDWSPYKTFTVMPFFPYFRRGQTRGMVADLMDPQQEVNKRRSTQIDIISRTANGGWTIHEDGVDDEQMHNWEENSSSPGFLGKWKGEAHMKPQQIGPSGSPVDHERLEMKSTDDLKEISGINDSMLGQLDRVQSGKALIERQRGGVLSIQQYMTNMSRTKELVARKKLEIIQNHYTEPRLVLVLGEDGSQDSLMINEQSAAGEILNNVTIGKYSVSVDETPLSASFVSAQFEELMELIEKQIIPVPAVMDVAVDLSSIPQKEMVKQRVQAFMQSQGIPTGDDVMTQGVAPGMPGQVLSPGMGDMANGGRAPSTGPQ